MTLETATLLQLSIIIPVHNAEQYIERCVDSFIGTFNAFSELILIDDGSTDDTKQRCRAIIERYPNWRIRYVYQANGGVSSARNHGLALAEGQWVYFVDADDFLVNSAQLFEPVVGQSVDWVLFRTKIERAGGTDAAFGLTEDGDYQYKTAKGLFLDHYYQNVFFQSCNKLYRRAIIEAEALRFDESLRIGEDLIFNLQYLQHCRVVRHRAAFLYVYEIGHAEAATSNLKPKWFSVNLTALHIIETQLVAGIAEVDHAAYTRFLKQYVRTFFRMLIVFDQRTLTVPERQFIQTQLINLERGLPNGTSRWLGWLNRSHLAPVMLVGLRRLKQRLK